MSRAHQYTKACAYAKCRKPFITKNPHTRHCSRACGMRNFAASGGMQRGPGGYGSEGGKTSAETRKRQAFAKRRALAIALGPCSEQEMAHRIECIRIGFKWGCQITYQKWRTRMTRDAAVVAGDREVA